MSFAPLVVQDCGCIALPEELAASLGMTPGVTLTLVVDSDSRTIRLTAPADQPVRAPVVLASCALKP